MNRESQAPPHAPLSSTGRDRVRTNSSPMAMGVLFLLGAGFFAFKSLDSPPPTESLQIVEGRLEQVVPEAGGKDLQPLGFRLSGDARMLHYEQKSGDMERVEQELQQAIQKPVRALVRSVDGYATVYEVIIDGRPVRSYADVYMTWRHDKSLALFGACVLAAIGAIVLLDELRR